MNEQAREEIREITRDFNAATERAQLGSSIRRLLELDGGTADSEAVRCVGEALEGAARQLWPDYPATATALQACAVSIEEGGTP